MDTSERLNQYRDIFADSSPLLTVRSPGRVNLIGEHTDYNDGFVLPMAMSQAMHVIAGQADNQSVKVYSTAFEQTAEFPADNPGGPDDYPDEPAWMKYVRGVAALLTEKGIKLRGCRLLIDSEVPIGGGVSSSAALEVGAAMALLGAAMSSLEGIELALLAQKAEHEYAHSPCGIMDQFICVLGKAEQALLLDCRTQKYDYVPLPMINAELVVMNTQVKHSIGGSEYPVRQQQCRDGLAVLQADNPRVNALRDADSKILEAHKTKMDETVYRRCRHVITENERTRQASDALKKQDLAAFGRLMYQSHHSLRDDYEVSCPELDRLVDIASGITGVYGARMTGGGFGGCAIALTHRDAVDPLKTAIAEKYDGQFEKPAIVYPTSPSNEPPFSPSPGAYENKNMSGPAINEIIAAVHAGRHLSRQQTREIFELIMTGQMSPESMANFLTALARKGETADEIAGAADVMNDKVSRVRCALECIDTCGTGGDGISTFNVSTTAAIIAAAAGATVAKHGNRTSTRVSGSAEASAQLGINLEADIPVLERCLEQFRIAFLYAPNLHPAMKHAGPVRKKLAIRTIFNLLGPLTNPAGAKRQVLGTSRPDLVRTLGQVMAAREATFVWVVHGEDGLCDLTITGNTQITQVHHGKVTAFEVHPRDVGFEPAPLEELLVESPHTSAMVIKEILEQKETGARRRHALLNAAAALVVAEKAESLSIGVEMATDAVDSGRALQTLQHLVQVSNTR